MSEHRLSSTDISACEVGTFEDVVLNFDERRPVTMVDGEFSLPWTLAAVLTGLPKGSGWYSPERLSDPEMHALADMVVLVVNDEAQRRHFCDERKTMSVVHLRTADGRNLERRIAVARGGVASPWPKGGIEAKFREQASPLLGDAGARELQDALLGWRTNRTSTMFSPCSAVRQREHT